VTEHLARAAGLALDHGAGGFVVAKRERVIYEAGDISAVINCRSIRKSLLNAVVGQAVAARRLRLDATLVELGIDDAVEPRLTAGERRARVRDLLTCRSGVYHPANHAGGPAAFATLPRRQSHRPGEWFYYNNWDFNALGAIVNQAHGRSLFDEFAEAIAEPAAMRDFDPALQRYVRQPYSEHPTYSFRISTRDLARFGQLYLRGGHWNGRQIVPPDWVAESTRVQTITPNGPGYGYLWWVAHEGRLFAGTTMPDGAFAAYGMGGQFLIVIPQVDLVIALLADPERAEQESRRAASHRRRLAQLVHQASEGLIPLAHD
jgi:CubicO group peptidase (beta-lactamase class C family)